MVGEYSNGSFATDANNCGACGNTCSFVNANAACSGGICAIGSCKTGFKDCNGDPSDGCEYTISNLASDSKNCAACGVVCQPGFVCSSGAAW